MQTDKVRGVMQSVAWIQEQRTISRNLKCLFLHFLELSVLFSDVPPQRVASCLCLEGKVVVGIVGGCCFIEHLLCTQCEMLCFPNISFFKVHSVPGRFKGEESYPEREGVWPLRREGSWAH